MKKNILTHLSFAAVLSLLLLSSCNNSKRSMFKADNGVEFDTIHVQKQYFLDNDPKKPSCNLTLNFIYPDSIAGSDAKGAKNVFVKTVLGQSYDSLSVEKAVSKYTENYVENYKNDAQIYIINKPGQGYIENPDNLHLSEDEHGGDDDGYLPEIFYSYYENLSDSIVYNQYGIISYKVTQINNKGGRMSYETVKNYVLNLSSGKLMNEDDVFSAGYDLALRPIIQNALLESNKVKSIRELEDLGFFGIDEIMPNRNFLITDKGITYTYNKGEYSAYQLTVPEVFIPYSAIRSLLRENSVVSKLARL